LTRHALICGSAHGSHVISQLRGDTEYVENRENYARITAIVSDSRKHN